MKTAEARSAEIAEFVGMYQNIVRAEFESHQKSDGNEDAIRAARVTAENALALLLGLTRDGIRELRAEALGV